MKATIKCKIESMKRNKDGVVELSLIGANGRVDVKSPVAQETSITGTLLLKAIVADQLKIGETINFDISTPEQ